MQDDSLDTGPLAQWLEPNSSLLDVACGDGQMLAWLVRQLSIRGCGVEIDTGCIQRCLESGLDVLEQDLNKELDMFTDKSFDTVLAKEALHYMTQPDRTLSEMLRIGKRVIVVFDNAGWWRHRAYFAGTGRYLDEHVAARSAWYRQHRPRLFSIADFNNLCHSIDCRILDTRFYPGVGFSANFFAARAWYLLQGN